MDSEFKGIVLQSTSFQDYHRIVTLFSENAGTLKFFVNNANQTPAKYGFLRPLCKVELLLRPGKKDLYYFQEGQFIKNFIESPKKFDEIHIATQLCKTLLTSQYANKPSFQLYMLFEAYLTALPWMYTPEVLLRSFQLKILIYEGFLNLDDLNTTIPFSEDELALLHLLATAKTLTDLDFEILPKTLSLKIQALYDEVLLI